MVFRSHSDALETELIRSLFYGLRSTVIMSLGFLVCGLLMVWEVQDPLLFLLLVAGGLASIVRIAVSKGHAAEAARLDLDIERARELQRRFTLSYFAFAVTLGMFGARAMQSGEPRIHMLMICLLVGYGAGVAATAGLRPRIAIPSMLAAIIPATLPMFAKLDPIYSATAVMTAAFLSGGVNSIQQRHERAVQDIGRRITFATLARRDTLTELPNRLALREWYDENVAFDDHAGLVAVHYLDLNGFKPVNDTYGHPVGDALLAAVGKRIARTIRVRDMAARLGGDEFAVIQRDIDKPEEVVLLANRLQAAIARPFRLDDVTVQISTCVGYVVSCDRGDDLEHLLSLADEALYTSKRGDRRVIGYELASARIERQAA